MNNNSMVPSKCKLEVPKKKERKITWAYGQKTSLKSRTLRGVPVLRRCPLRVRESQLWCTLTTIRKLLFYRWDAYDLDTE